MIEYGTGISLSADVPFLQARIWRNNREVFRWCRQYTGISPQAHSDWFEKMQTDPTIKMFAIYLDHPGYQTEDVCLGVCGLTSIDRVNQKAEFSLYIAPNHQKKGYGKKALYTLVKHGFEDHNLHRIWGETYEGNPALKMFDSLGFKREGCLRQSYFREGRFIDSIIVAKIRGES